MRLAGALFFLIVLFIAGMGFADAQDGLTVVAVGNAEAEQDRVLVDNPSIEGPANSSLKTGALEAAAVMRNDLSFYKKRYGVVENKTTDSAIGSSPDYTALVARNIRYAIRLRLAGGSTLSMQAYDVSKRSTVAEAQESLSGDVRRAAHRLSNAFHKAIAGKDGMFEHKIIFVSDKTSSGSTTRKEVYIMDYDGKNVRPLTNHGGTTISPDISPDGGKIIYSLIKSGNRNRNVDLYEMDLKTHNSEVISSRKGINSGAVYLPDGKNIVLTLSHTGNAEIYKLNLASGQITEITKHYAADVDPSFNKDGSMMAFLSDRPGKAMIYTMDPRTVEKDVKRIGFVGQFNATPRFSPDGKEIVFASWVDDRFDLFRLNADGSGLGRLTKNFGSNEEPAYSPDGEFIIFSSQRVLSRKKAIQDIYIMDRDGEILGPLTSNMGNCLTPRWSK